MYSCGCFEINTNGSEESDLVESLIERSAVLKPSIRPRKPVSCTQICYNSTESHRSISELGAEFFRKNLTDGLLVFPVPFNCPECHLPLLPSNVKLFMVPMYLRSAVINCKGNLLN